MPDSEHVIVQPGDIVRFRKTGWQGRVTKVYGDGWGCDAICFETGREQSILQASLDLAQVMRPDQKEGPGDVR